MAQLAAKLRDAMILRAGKKGQAQSGAEADALSSFLDTELDVSEHSRPWVFCHALWHAAFDSRQGVAPCDLCKAQQSQSEWGGQSLAAPTRRSHECSLPSAEPHVCKKKLSADILC
jgi:hypothetical protein